MLSYLCTNIFYKQNSLSSLLEIPILTICAKPALEWRKNAVTVLVAIWVAAIGVWVLQNDFLLHFVSMSVLLLFSFLSTERGTLKRIKFGFGLFFQPPHIWSGCWNSQQFEFGARQSRSLAIILFEQCWEVLFFFIFPVNGKERMPHVFLLSLCRLMKYFVFCSDEIYG